LKNDPDRRYRSVEQFAEDIQRHLDGLPVIARKDTLYYRSSKFVLRHRVAVTTVMLVFVIGLMGISIIVREKRKADRRFNDVRQLANSLMFEVDSEIQKGPTKGRAMIAKRALEYLDSLALEAGNDYDLQLELAAGYLKVGDIQGKPYRPNLGDTVGAEMSYRKAQALLESLTATNAATSEANSYLSLSYQSLGRVQERNGEWDAALESEGHAVALSEALAAADPSNLQYRNLLADNYLHYGEALYSTGRGATITDDYQAIDYFRKALAIHSSLVVAEPNNADYRYATGVDYEYLGIAYNLLGDRTGNAENYVAALENHTRELEINEGLAASDPSNAAYRRIVADVYGEIGLSQLKLGKTVEALENFRRKLSIFESVKASDPTNVEAIRDVVNALPETSQALKKLGNTAEALSQMRKAVGLQQTLCDAEPNNVETCNQLRILSEAVAELQRKGNN
jgi:non-specific serine/threonine protein kinase/serine/threonine-protein kinase